MKVARILFLLCLLFAGPIPWLVGSSVYPYELFIIPILIIIAKKKLYRSAKSKLIPEYSIKPIIRFGVLFIISVAIGTVLSYIENMKIERVPTEMMFKIIFHILLTILVLVCAFLSGFTLFKGSKDLHLVAWVSLFSMILIAFQSDISWIVDTGGVISRYNFEPPTGLGQGDTSKMCILGLLFAFFLFIYKKKLFTRTLLLASFIVLGLSILVIQSRAAYLTAVIQVFALIYILNKSDKTNIKLSMKIFLTLFGVVIFSFIFYTLFFTNLSENMGEMVKSDSDQSVNRISAMLDAFRMFTENPFFGVGWGQFVVNTQVAMYISGIGHVVSSPHNGLSQLLGETGIIGTLLSYILSYFILAKTWQLKKNTIENESKVFIGLFFVIFFIIIVTSFIVSSYLFPPPTQRDSVRISFYYWFFIGYVLSFMKNNDTIETNLIFK